MDKESLILLQQIDCNCNDCKFMTRNIEKYKQSEKFHYDIQFKEFTEEKEQELFIAMTLREPGMLRKARNKVFQFVKPPINYGDCDKFKKPVSFIPNTCQLDTQECFEHRRI